VRGAVIAIQSFGDFLGFNPHLHILISDGCFYENGMFPAAATIDTKTLENIFRDKVLKMLMAKELPDFDALVQEKMKKYTGK
jgi:hypothetical protein